MQHAEFCSSLVKTYSQWGKLYGKIVFSGWKPTLSNSVVVLPVSVAVSIEINKRQYFQRVPRIKTSKPTNKKMIIRKIPPQKKQHQATNLNMFSGNTIYFSWLVSWFLRFRACQTLLGYLKQKSAFCGWKQLYGFKSLMTMLYKQL